LRSAKSILDLNCERGYDEAENQRGFESSREAAMSREADAPYLNRDMGFLAFTGVWFNT
jgi:hypothetical protein